MNISLRRLIAVAHKEFLHVGRDWRSLALALAIPVVLILLFGYALTMDLKNVPTVVWDQSQTPQSRAFLSHIDGSPYFAITKQVVGYQALTVAIERRRALVALVIPGDFADRLQAGLAVGVQVILEGSDANNAGLAAGYLAGLGQLFNRQVLIERTHVAGRGAVGPTVDLQIRAWFNSDLRSRNVIVPGIIALVMAVIAAMLTSVTVAREWETGTMEQLMSTPLKVPELVIGKVVPYFVIGLSDVAIAVVMGRFLFDVPLRGNPALLFAMASVFLCGSLFMGLTLSILLKTQVLANQLSIVANYLPTLLLSGFVFSIHNMPPAIQLITHIVPGRYFIAILRGIYLKGIGLEVLWFNAVMLSIYAVVMVAAAHLLMRFKLEA